MGTCETLVEQERWISLFEFLLNGLGDTTAQHVLATMSVHTLSAAMLRRVESGSCCQRLNA